MPPSGLTATLRHGTLRRRGTPGLPPQAARVVPFPVTRVTRRLSRVRTICWTFVGEEGRRTTRVAGVDRCPQYVAWTRLVLRPLSAPRAPAGSRRRPSGPTDIGLGPARRCGGHRARHTTAPRRCATRRQSPRAPGDAPARLTPQATSRWRSPRPRPAEAAPAASAARRTRPGLALPRSFPPTR